MTELVINYCTNHQPKTFYMDITTGICSINIPDSFFNCKSIEEVRFFVLDKNGDYKFRPSTVDMPNLRKIHFKCISFDDSKMKEFLSGTGNLKILTLEYCTLEMEGIFFENLESLELLSPLYQPKHEEQTFSISAPKLKFLTIDGDIHVPIIKSTVIDEDCDFLSSLRGVYDLELCFEEDLVDILKNAPYDTTFPNLTVLTLSNSCILCWFEEIRDFVTSCTNLEELNLFQSNCKKTYVSYFNIY